MSEMLDRHDPLDSLENMDRTQTMLNRQDFDIRKMIKEKMSEY